MKSPIGLLRFAFGVGGAVAVRVRLSASPDLNHTVLVRVGRQSRWRPHPGHRLGNYTGNGRGPCQTGQLACIVEQLEHISDLLASK